MIVFSIWSLFIRCLIIWMAIFGVIESLLTNGGTMDTQDIEPKTCVDNFVIESDKIIRTEESKRLGGKYLNGQDLITKDECLKFCCETIGCNVFIFEEKQSGTCYLFDCGTQENFKCRFTKHHNYSSAFLIINRPSVELEDEIKYTQHEHELAKLRNGFNSNGDADTGNIVKSTSKSNALGQILPSLSVENEINYKDNPKMASSETTSKKSRCSRNQFECRKSGECIAIYNTCDGIPQCSDRSDEDAELGCPTTPPFLKPSEGKQHNEMMDKLPEAKDLHNVDNVWNGNNRNYTNIGGRYNNNNNNYNNVENIPGDVDSDQPLPKQLQRQHLQQSPYTGQSRMQHTSNDKAYQPNVWQSHYNQQTYNSPNKGFMSNNQNFPAGNNFNNINNDDNNNNNNNNNNGDGSLNSAAVPSALSAIYAREGEFIENNPWANQDTSTKIFKQNNYGPLHNFNHKSNMMSNHAPINYVENSPYQNFPQYDGYNNVMMPMTGNNYYHYLNNENQLPIRKQAPYAPVISDTQFRNANSINGAQLSDVHGPEYYYNEMNGSDLKFRIPAQMVPANQKIKHEVQFGLAEGTKLNTDVSRKNTVEIKTENTTTAADSSSTISVPIFSSTIVNDSAVISTTRAASTTSMTTSTAAVIKTTTTVVATDLTTSRPLNNSSSNKGASLESSSDETHSHKKMEQPLLVDAPSSISQNIGGTDDSYKLVTQPTGAIAALSAGLFLTCVMLFVIGCRLRLVRRRIRRGRSSSRRDADFLVNGMYL